MKKHTVTISKVSYGKRGFIAEVETASFCVEIYWAQTRAAVVAHLKTIEPLKEAQRIIKNDLRHYSN